MNFVFVAALVIYMLLFLMISIRDMKKVNGTKDYTTAGKRQGTYTVTMTLLATAIGASTTIGITDTVYSIGFPGIWWLAFGAIGLILQSFFLSEKVRNTGADTLPELATITVGKAAGTLLALIIVIAWIGVIAGQFVAVKGIIAFVTGSSDIRLFVMASVIVIIYTVAGGQLAVVKTDRIQLVIIITGVALSFIYLYFIYGGNTAGAVKNIELCNESYRPTDLLTQFFAVGGVYFFGPDIISRNFLSKDVKTAKKSALYAGACLLVFSILITLIGMWAKFNVTSDMLGDNKVLMYVVGVLPPYIGILLAFGLLSAVLSSADTCLINASLILVKDIFKKDSIAFIRISAAVIGTLSVLLAVGGCGDIMNLLMSAYSIYTPGIIFPLTVAVLAYGRCEINKTVWLISVIAGGAFGVMGTYFSGLLSEIGMPSVIIKYSVLIGMAISLCLSLLSLLKNKGK